MAWQDGRCERRTAYITEAKTATQLDIHCVKEKALTDVL